MALAIDGAQLLSAWLTGRAKMTVADIESHAPIGPTKRCPHCRAARLHWFGIIRICAACGKLSHWREVLSDE
jgi:hypothetical protein